MRLACTADLAMLTVQASRPHHKQARRRLTITGERFIIGSLVALPDLLEGPSARRRGGLSVGWCRCGESGVDPMFKLAMIAAGGAFGALARYFLAGWGQRLGNDSFPTGTLIVNLVGCLCIGLLSGFFAGPHLVREEYRVAILVGAVGAFTTFSTFGWETFALANSGQLWLALVNVLLSNGLGLFSIWFSYRLAEKWFGV